MNYEVVNGTLDYRKRNGKILKETEVTLSAVDNERYISAFGFDNSIYDHIALNGSVSDFNGNYLSRCLWFDIDSKDLAAAKETALNFVRAIRAFERVS